MLEWRLKGYEAFKKSKMPTWQNFEAPDVDFQSISYYAAPKDMPKYESLDEVDPELLRTYERLGIPLEEQKIGRASCRERVRGKDERGGESKARVSERR